MHAYTYLLNASNQRSNHSADKDIDDASQTRATAFSTVDIGYCVVLLSVRRKRRTECLFCKFADILTETYASMLIMCVLHTHITYVGSVHCLFYMCTLQRALHVLVPMCWLLDVMKLQKWPKWLYFPCILIVLHQSLQGGAFDRSVWTYCFPSLFFVMQWDFQRDSFFLEYRYQTQYEGSWNMQQHSFSI